jgi:hypothetical protein
VRLVRRCDDGFNASKEIGETVRRGGLVWLGLAGHELGERESEVARSAGGGSVARDSEEKRANSEERERAETE